MTGSTLATTGVFDYAESMKARLLFLALFFGVFAFFLFREDFEEAFFQGKERLQGVSGSLTNTVQEKIGDLRSDDTSLPGPLRAETDAPDARLTREGIVRETNAQRGTLGLPALVESAQLTAMAEAKVKDMFANQYFAHGSPSGRGIADLTKDAGYVFIAVGENLALGGFADDAALVQAWMDSPGHRANIVSTRFRDIGVAVGKGQYEGQEAWFAVQHFGFARSACPEPDAEAKKRIDAQNARIKELSSRAEADRAALEREQPQTQEEVDARKRKVETYNALLKEMNALTADTRQLVQQYNGTVEAYNRCAKGE